MTKKTKYGLIGFLLGVIPHGIFLLVVEAVLGFPLRDLFLFMARGLLIGIIGFITMYFVGGVSKFSSRISLFVLFTIIII